MKKTLLSLITAGLLTLGTSTADAQQPSITQGLRGYHGTTITPKTGSIGPQREIDRSKYHIQSGQYFDPKLGGHYNLVTVTQVEGGKVVDNDQFLVFRGTTLDYKADRNGAPIFQFHLGTPQAGLHKKIGMTTFTDDKGREFHAPRGYIPHTVRGGKPPAQHNQPKEIWYPGKKIKESIQEINWYPGKKVKETIQEINWYPGKKIKETIQENNWYPGKKVIENVKDAKEFIFGHKDCRNTDVNWYKLRVPPVSFTPHHTQAPTYNTQKADEISHTQDRRQMKNY